LKAEQAAKCIDVFEVDKLFLEEQIECWRTAGDRCSHGTSKFRLDGLMNQAKPLAAAFARKKQIERSNEEPNIEIKIRESVLPTKKRVMPKGGEDDWSLSEGERIIREPAAYLASDASLKLILRLHRPVRTLIEDGAQFIGERILESRPFTKAVFVFEYSNVPMLHAVNRAMDAINTAALGDSIQGSLRSHQLSQEQVESADVGLLDVLCGFQLIDDHCRTIVVEGLVGAIKRLMDQVPRAAANNRACRILFDPTVAFHKRLYTAFSVDLKKIRLRDPLPILCEMPEIYNRTKVK